MQDQNPIDISALPGVVSPKTGRRRRAVLVTTTSRGIFFGYLASKPRAEYVILARVRNVVYFHESVRGFLGLASLGPNEKCRIGPAAPNARLEGITSIVTVTEEAAQAFERGPWGR